MKKIFLLTKLFFNKKVRVIKINIHNNLNTLRREKLISWGKTFISLLFYSSAVCA